MWQCANVGMSKVLVGGMGQCGECANAIIDIVGEPVLLAKQIGKGGFANTGHADDGDGFLGPL